MPQPHIILLDGSETDDRGLSPMFQILQETLQRYGKLVKTYDLRAVKPGHCVGCFGCWLKTPGICVQPDIGHEIAAAMIQSDIVVLFSPVVFGGYSPALKRVIDRCFSPLLQPYMSSYHGETHHIPRYAQAPRLVGIGVQRRPDEHEANIFKHMVGRNALNLHSPSYGAVVVNATESVESLRQQFGSVLQRNNEFPLRTALQSLMPQAEQFPAHISPGRRALLLIGSPKGKRSTSACLGQEVTARLEARGWETDTLTLLANMTTEKSQGKLLNAVQRADLLILAFPLYNDSMPVSVIEALQVIDAQRNAVPLPGKKQLLVLLNNGFPEVHQNIPAIAVCRKFAAQCEMDWAGCLAFGAGEALSGGQPLGERKGLPSVKHILSALDLTIDALHNGQSVPQQAVKMIARTPIPLVPFIMWRWIFIKKASGRWQQKAAKNNLRKEQLLVRIYRP